MVVVVVVMVMVMVVVVVVGGLEVIRKFVLEVQVDVSS